MVYMTVKEDISWLFVVREQEIDGQETPGNAKEHIPTWILLCCTITNENEQKFSSYLSSFTSVSPFLIL